MGNIDYLQANVVEYLQDYLKTLIMIKSWGKDGHEEWEGRVIKVCDAIEKILNV